MLRCYTDADIEVLAQRPQALHNRAELYRLRARPKYEEDFSIIHWQYIANIRIPSNLRSPIKNLQTVKVDKPDPAPGIRSKLLGKHNLSSSDEPWQSDPHIGAGVAIKMSILPHGENTH
jgi:hypothetical protein